MNLLPNQAWAAELAQGTNLFGVPGVKTLGVGISNNSVSKADFVIIKLKLIKQSYICSQIEKCVVVL